MSSFQTYKVIGNRTVAANSFSIGSPISNSGSYHTEVNTMLAGSMMISLSFLVIGLCFFLHRKLKREPGPVSLHTLPWTDENLEIFTLSGQEEVTGIYLPQPTPSPPPSYELVVKIRDKEEESSTEKACSTQAKEEKITMDDEDLPSYDAAMKLGAHGLDSVYGALGHRLATWRTTCKDRGFTAACNRYLENKITEWITDTQGNFL